MRTGLRIDLRADAAVDATSRQRPFICGRIISAFFMFVSGFAMNGFFNDVQR